MAAKDTTRSDFDRRISDYRSRQRGCTLPADGASGHFHIRCCQLCERALNVFNGESLDEYCDVYGEL